MIVTSNQAQHCHPITVESSSRSNRLINRAATIARSTTNGNIVTNGRRGSNPISFGSNNRPTSSSGSASLSSAYGSSDSSNARDKLLDMIATFKVADEQRAPLSRANILPDVDFFEQLMKCHSSRLEDQRLTFQIFLGLKPHQHQKIFNYFYFFLSPSPTTSSSSARANFARHRSATVSNSNAVGPTGPSKPISEDFFGLIMRSQSARIEDQWIELLGDNQSDDGDDENNEGGKNRLEVQHQTHP
ncbi:uncharacterized protein LOC112538934 [Tetranychus urticae]|uniref:uncharacterized protein LOC112538934 n=1 Tax=Tetranychus urticae TaxID=32264 RepID=UPI000D64F5E8|nr:uncharacterized protein LOC112538934 [Tetranychus urticae]